jgi:hypothetical protein
LILPNAYNIFARIGEVTYISASANTSGNHLGSLEEAVKYFARSVELSEWYLRGWYGLKFVTGKILRGKSADGSTSKMEALNELATEKLVQIVTRFERNEEGWTGFDEAEVRAAKDLVSNDENTTAR